MSDQPTLPGMTRGETREERGKRLRDEAINRVGDGVGQVWMDRAMQSVRDVARTSITFTSDDVRAWAKRSGLSEPHEPRAWGAVMNRAIKSGLIVKTGEMVPTLRPEAHRRPIPVYRAATHEERDPLGLHKEGGE